MKPKIELDPLALMWVKRRLKILQAREMHKLARDIRRMNKEMEPHRKLAEERRKAGVLGEGFIMRSCYNG